MLCSVVRDWSRWSARSGSVDRGEGRTGDLSHHITQTSSSALASSTGLRVALAHDYLTQYGGAERVALEMSKAFPDAPMLTAFYSPENTYPEFGDVEIETSQLNRLPALRRNPRLAFPLLAPTFSHMRSDAEVTLVSSSGWAHGINAAGRKIVYCHAPARWLYQTDRYLGASAQFNARSLSSWAQRGLAKTALEAAKKSLLAWDKRAALTADRYLANSSVTQSALRDVYGIDADVVPPPPALLPDGPTSEFPGLSPGYLLCVSRLLPYKNVDRVISAMALLPDEHLVLVGTGPQEQALRQLASSGHNVTFVGRVDDSTLRWLYRNASALIAASFEDYGLTPLEASSFGVPVAVLRAGGYLDTVVENQTGVFFDDLQLRSIADSVARLRGVPWNEDHLKKHAAMFGQRRFQETLRRIVDET